MPLFALCDSRMEHFARPAGDGFAQALATTMESVIIRHKIAWICAGCAIACLGTWVFFGSPAHRDGPRKALQRGDSEMAYTMSQKFVKTQLIAPSSGASLRWDRFVRRRNTRLIVGAAVG